ncbi:MAG: tetratricopeptide repeat protein [Terriglobia bacterium]
MRRDLLITALAFLTLGFLGGYLVSESSRAPQPSAPAAGGGAATSAAGEELPSGHPPARLARRWLELEQQVQENPEDAEVALRFALFLDEAQRWSEAARAYGRVLELAPENAEVLVKRGTVHFHLGRVEEAVADFERALALNPDQPRALYGLALARLQGQRDVAGARAAYERLRRSHPDYPGLELLAQQLEGGENR